MLDREFLLGLVAQKTAIQSVIIQGKTFFVDSSEISYSDVPVSRPTIRGGVYHTDTMAFKARVTISDGTISSVLSKTMLGPNQEFAQIEVIASDKTRIFANLTNYVQKSTGYDLNLVLVDTLPK